MAGRLQDKRIVVTGAGSGIGRAAVVRFAAEGAQVLAVDIDEAGLGETLDEVGAALAICVADVSNPTDMELVAKTAENNLGGLDGVYANAGIPAPGNALEISIEAWHRTLSVNLTGVWLTGRCLLPLLIKAGGGSIVNQASVGGVIVVPGIAAYAASKGGVIALTRSMAVDFASAKVRVNALCPSTVPTPLVRRTYTERARMRGLTTSFESMLQSQAERIPLGRLGTLDDVTSICSFLLSDEASWITGQAIVLDGGMSVA
jgi:NAD(P)-dependent dehydrogenase (short-subunit alcohol dehydrogenase family)